FGGERIKEQYQTNQTIYIIHCAIIFFSRRGKGGKEVGFESIKLPSFSHWANIFLPLAAAKEVGLKTVRFPLFLFIL
ncbi:MAG TPA: hypothetical protein PK695_05705, partial [Chitinophagaceae bacterium]|nr:hypothetical protein [Chitinophagaceae bacterium]